MSLHLPFICGYCGRVVWPWQEYVTDYKPFSVKGDREHVVCIIKKEPEKEPILVTCDDPKEFMEKWEKVMKDNTEWKEIRVGRKQ